MAGKAAVDGDAEKALLEAEILVAIGAVAALTAADPGKHRFPRADQLFGNIGADFLDNPRDLVSERERQCRATGGIEPLAAAEVGIAVLDVEVGVAEPAALDPDKNLLALRLRRLHDGFAQWRVELD